MNEVRNHAGITEYYERKAATARYGGFANVDELRTAYERMREDFAQYREQSEYLFDLDLRESVLLRGLLDQYVMGLLNMIKHPDVTEKGQKQYRESIAEAEHLRHKLETWELRQ